MFKFIMWLAYWYQQAEAFEFDWDSGNWSKSSVKHGVSVDEVESVFALKLAAPIGRQIAPKVEDERLCIVGPSSTGKMISVVFILRAGRIRPISSRPASRKERKLYEEVRKATQRVR